MSKRIPNEVTMMEVRQQPGEVFRAVEYEGREIIVTKNGRAIARIVPVSDITIINSDGSFTGPTPLMFRKSLGDHY